ncbi:hypothetical protein O0544_16260 [Edwardsiella anguillarum]|nr:hypothetical protein [Edwardsiella anguillarum]
MVDSPRGRDLWLFLLCGLLAGGGALRGRSGGEGWRVDMMDVGHGQAIAISRNGQALLYDSGGAGRAATRRSRSCCPTCAGRDSG